MKKTSKIISIAIISVMLALSFTSCNNKSNKTVSQKESSQNQIVLTNPPVPELDIPYQKFKINPDSSVVLHSKMGTEIKIPSGAFLDENGNVIKNEVDLTFREFYNPLDFFLAGIPMNYEEDGVVKAFESGGMVELNAESNGKPVFVNPKNKIVMDLNSWTDETNFNLYDLDPKSGKWIERNKDIVKIDNIKKELDSLPIIPEMPRKQSSASFEIKDDTKNHPEINEYENVMFQPVDDQCGATDATDIKIKSLKNGTYELTFIVKFDEAVIHQRKCICYLAFKEGKDYNNALKQYKKKYGAMIKKREKMKKEIDKKWKIYNDIVSIHRKNDLKKLDAIDRVTRTLEINNFGFTNIDRPTSYPQGNEIEPIYTDEEGNIITIKNVVLVELDTNALFRYENIVKYNHNKKNMLWGITSEGKLAYLKAPDFKLIVDMASKQKIKMHTYNGKLESQEDIMKVCFDKNNYPKNIIFK
ncbi:hypothetical protein [Flavobacterium sp.]|uniref:hypothetical protein n=1 Tax=Flavobacterium sp. TaxID=239 RepID=UPI002B61C8F9|nr:hypothetical protein [Flavobacterium sp.]HSD07658.1 hypothetical protein [Flavobacterium sp.]